MRAKDIVKRFHAVIVGHGSSLGRPRASISPRSTVMPTATADALDGDTDLEATGDDEASETGSLGSVGPKSRRGMASISRELMREEWMTQTEL